jgi:hypothetical protein
LTSRAISADTIKMPEPIMDPMTRVVALVSPSPFTNSGAPDAACAGVLCVSADVDIGVLYVLPQNAQKIRNCFRRGLKKVRNHGHRVRACGFYLRTIQASDPADGH